MKLVNWIRNKILKFLNIPEIYIGVDVCFKQSSNIIIVKHDKKRNTIEVISDTDIREKSYTELVNAVRSICRNYKIRPEIITWDKPPILHNFGDW